MRGFPLIPATSNKGDPKDEQSEQSEPGPAEPEPGSEARPAAGRRPEAGPAAAGTRTVRTPAIRTASPDLSAESEQEGPAERRGFSFARFAGPA